MKIEAFQIENFKCTLTHTNTIDMTRSNNKIQKTDDEGDWETNPVELFDTKKSKPSKNFKNTLKAQMLAEFEQINEGKNVNPANLDSGFNIFSALFVTYFSFGVSFVCLILIAVISISNLNILPGQDSAQSVYLNENEKKEIARNIVENNSQELITELINVQQSLNNVEDFTQNLNTSNAQTTTKNLEINNNTNNGANIDPALSNFTKLVSISEKGDKYQQCYSDKVIFSKLQTTIYSYFQDGILTKSKTEISDLSNNIIETKLVNYEANREIETLYRGGKHAVKYEVNKLVDENSQPASYPTSYPETSNILVENVEKNFEISETVTIDGEEYYIAKTTSTLNCSGDDKEIIIKTYINKKSYQIEMIESYLENDSKANLISKFTSKAKVESVAKSQIDKTFSISQRVINLSEKNELKNKIAIVENSDALEIVDNLSEEKLIFDFYTSSYDFYPSSSLQSKHLEFFNVNNNLFSYEVNAKDYSIVISVITPSTSDLPSKIIMNESDKDQTKLYAKIDQSYVEILPTESRVSNPVSENNIEYGFIYRGFKYLLKFKTNQIDQTSIPEFKTVENL